MPYKLNLSSPSAEDISHELNVFIGETRGKLDAALSAFSGLANRVYGYSHDAKVAKDLEAVYADIIEDSPELADKSAVGFTAFLEDGDKIETQGNICYINGDLTETDYTFSGENSEGGFEICAVWYFENDGALNCISREFGLIDAIIKKNITEITSSEEFFAFANSIKTNIVLPFAPYAARKQVNDKTGIYLDSVSATLQEYESNIAEIKKINNQMLSFFSSTALKNVRFPELTAIEGVSDLNFLIFSGCSNLVIDDASFPKLETIGSSVAPAQWSMFKSVPTVVLPESMTSVGAGVCRDNKIIVLKSKNATFATNWCGSTPTERFEMVDDWGATINIAVAAANWSINEFVDLIFNKLRDVHTGTGETLYIGADKHRLLAGHSIGNDEIALDGAWFYFDAETGTYQPYTGTVDTDDAETDVDGVLYRNPLRKAISLGWTVKN